VPKQMRYEEAYDRQNGLSNFIFAINSTADDLVSFLTLFSDILKGVKKSENNDFLHKTSHFE
jgi:hypothetical protein